MLKPCKKILDTHIDFVSEVASKTDSWKLRHAQAWVAPRGSERAIRSLLYAYAEMADSYTADNEGERKLGQDGYYHEHAADILKAARAYLNFDCGRFDCGTLDRLVSRLAEASGLIQKISILFDSL